MEGHSEDEVTYHLALLIEAGYLDGEILPMGGRDDGTPKIADTHVRRLTMKGHDFLDAVRDDDVWAATKKKVAATVATTSLGVLKALAVQTAKEKLGLP